MAPNPAASTAASFNEADFPFEFPFGGSMVISACEGRLVEFPASFMDFVTRTEEEGIDDSMTSRVYLNFELAGWAVG